MAARGQRKLGPVTGTMSEILSVGLLTEQIKRLVEGGFPYVWVRGEVSNLARPGSGHVYFTLKDAAAQLACVWFKGSQREEERFDPLTGEVFEDGPRPGLVRALRNGQEIVCAGRLAVYAPRGAYQLVVEMAQDSGRGRLFEAFEALKKRLREKGYFSPERKRPLPLAPARVALLTAPNGAAIQDFLRISKERGVGAEIRIHPVPVQGEAAPARLCEALAAANAEGWAEVVVLIRGGGSLEDLWAYNNETLADAILASRLPVLAGIGHESDVSIADMTADCRAATPTHAAHMLWPERDWYWQRVDEAELALTAALNQRLDGAGRRLESLERALAWLSPLRHLERQDATCREATARLERVMPRLLEQAATRASGLVTRLVTVMPRLLERAAERERTLTERLARVMPRLLDREEGRHRALTTQLDSVWQRGLEHRDRELERLELRLEAVNPEAPLRRGYALASTPDGRLVRSVRGLAPGSDLRIRVQDGTLAARVTAVDAEET